MSNTVIHVDGLSKQFRIGAPERYRTLRDTLTETVSAPFRRLFSNQPAKVEAETIWALKDVSFEVKHGDVVGIIGRNGAGKSTLLKILSRITEPTKGTAEIRGRVGSLLEVGTGFHPELTGRENIFLNGAILGMKKADITRKFDEIVAFAEVDKFIDTPVKHYSSGMYVRLAFAVAAHMDPEILIIDEVLAVGDADFQKKCLGKMEQSSLTDGRTVLFVSHNIAAIESLCTSAILLSDGAVAAKGDTRSVVQEYLRSMRRGHIVPLAERRDRQGSGEVRMRSFSLADGRGRRVPLFQCGKDAELVLEFENTTPRELKLGVSLEIDNEQGQRILFLDSAMLGQAPARVAPGRGVIRTAIPHLPLLPARYYVTASLTANGTNADWISHAGHFDVEAGDFYGTGQLPYDGLFAMNHRFRVEAADDYSADCATSSLLVESAS